MLTRSMSMLVLAACYIKCQQQRPWDRHLACQTAHPTLPPRKSRQEIASADSLAAPPYDVSDSC